MVIVNGTIQWTQSVRTILCFRNTYQTIDLLNSNPFFPSYAEKKRRERRKENSQYIYDTSFYLFCSSAFTRKAARCDVCAHDMYNGKRGKGSGNCTLIARDGATCKCKIDSTISYWVYSTITIGPFPVTVSRVPLLSFGWFIFLSTISGAPPFNFKLWGVFWYFKRIEEFFFNCICGHVKMLLISPGKRFWIL